MQERQEKMLCICSSSKCLPENEDQETFLHWTAQERNLLEISVKEIEEFMHERYHQQARERQ